ncbi:chemotaxis protein CheX [Desulfurivibrio dismutans]|uniref:chemotaxis protein CheX n=1 Tax=Desulfurivibrio dismutans TaxID=1398908 RepID=UPI0023D9989D|nr:chemotaxis protein CheX [Desulfurivibrio alkaliphilus]MDF1615169.1 chemotaxis protein CheX [Desulfurivibrio alkaliphilus]
MDEQFRQMIYDTFSEVFETMFFTFLEPIDELSGAVALSADDDYIQANISYHGPESGRFALYLPQRLARNITMNFLGVEAGEVGEAQILDTAKETANMAVGSLLGRVDPGGEAKLHIPEAYLLDDFSAQELLEQPGALLFNTDFGALWVVFKN